MPKRSQTYDAWINDRKHKVIWWPPDRFKVKPLGSGAVSGIHITLVSGRGFDDIHFDLYLDEKQLGHDYSLPKDKVELHSGITITPQPKSVDISGYTGILIVPITPDLPIYFTSGATSEVSVWAKSSGLVHLIKSRI